MAQSSFAAWLTRRQERRGCGFELIKGYKRRGRENSFVIFLFLLLLVFLVLLIFLLFLLLWFFALSFVFGLFQLLFPIFPFCATESRQKGLRIKQINCTLQSFNVFLVICYFFH